MPFPVVYYRREPAEDVFAAPVTVGKCCSAYGYFDAIQGIDQGLVSRI